MALQMALAFEERDWPARRQPVELYSRLHNVGTWI